jgi:hypothetical protein
VGYTTCRTISPATLSSRSLPIHGELTVPLDVDDEPAAVLLGKIRKEMVKLGKKGKSERVLDLF